MTPGVPPRLPLVSQRLVVVTGKGGVGKTTVTAALAYAAIDRVESFGSVVDYVLAFAGGFGITEAVKGFNQVVTKLRGG